MARHCGKGFITKCVTGAAVALISGMAFAGPGTAPFDSPMYHGSIERDIQSRALWATPSTGAASVGVARWEPATTTSPLSRQDPDMRGDALYDVGANL